MKKHIEKAFLVGVDWQENKFPISESLAELSRLAYTAGAEVIGSSYQRIEKPNPRFFIGNGKAEEIASIVKAQDIDVVIFDDELSPSQQTNLEPLFPRNVKVIDRTALILDIFGTHAMTREGKLQVQLAQLQYLLPRLRGMWSHLAKEQTRGGIGSRFGMGESQLEVDRRLIRQKISSLKRELKQVAKVRDTKSKVRKDSHLFRIALAGYTNAGKSSLLNALTGSEVLSQDLLFATLDPTTRRLVLPEGREVTITDTVGFIQKLPTTLVESFHSTLSEVIDADLILEVVDASSEHYEYHIKTVDKVLSQIGAQEIPKQIVFNKVDLLDSSELTELKVQNRQGIFVSAQSQTGLDELIEFIAKKASEADTTLEVTIPYTQGQLLETAHSRTYIYSEEFTDTGIKLRLQVPSALLGQFEPYTNPYVS